MKFFKLMTVLLLVLFVTSCASSLVNIEKENTPFERPSYIIFSPAGDGWKLDEFDISGGHSLVFGLPDLTLKSRTHTLYTRVDEIYSYAKFDSPEDFLSFFRKGQLIGEDPRRFNTIESVSKLDEKFGDYSISYYMKAEDHGARYRDAPYLIIESLGYYFIHPYAKNLIVNVYRSERGKPDELDKSFKDKALQFIDGLKLKNRD